MKEVIYIQAGELSNYTGAHFWNTQESYLSNGNTEIEPDASFCGSVDDQNESTLYPRLLVFDRKANFGTLAADNALESLADEASDTQNLWANGLVEYRQEAISKSTYQKQMDEEGNDADNSNQPSSNQTIGDVRYWSDISRVYYLPRSLQKLPDLPEWETSTLSWNQGQELFKSFDEGTELMDGAFRLLVEDCDNPQGIQIMNDTSTFGGFLTSFLSAFRDEYLKLPSFTMPLMSGAITESPTGYDVNIIKQLINEAFYLRTLNEFSSMNIPIQDPVAWPSSLWDDSLGYPRGSIYHQSAVLSTHVESCTLPFRQKNTRQSMADVASLLNWRNACPFGELSGAFPVNTVSTLDQRIINFSSNASVKMSRPYAQLTVTRGFSPNQLEAHAKWSVERQSSRFSSVASLHLSAYPMPNSFPPIAKDQTQRSFPVTSPATAEVLSSVSASPDIAKMLERYTLLVENSVKRRGSLLSSIDVSLDDLQELAHDLRMMHDNALEDSPDFL